MKFMDLKCQHCDADLKLDLDNLQAFCPYCGSKLLIDIEKLSDVFKEKERTKQVIEKEEHITKRKELEYNYKKEKEKSDFRQFLIVEGACFGILFLIGFGNLLIDYLQYIFIGLGIVLGLLICYLVYKVIKKKK